MNLSSVCGLRIRILEVGGMSAKIACYHVAGPGRTIVEEEIVTICAILGLVISVDGLHDFPFLISCQNETLLEHPSSFGRIFGDKVAHGEYADLVIR